MLTIKRLQLLVVLLTSFSGITSTRGTKCQKISAAFNLEDNGDVYFLSDGEYIKYNILYDSEAKVGPIRELGLDHEIRNADAAFTWKNGTVYFLKECALYRYNRTQNQKRILKFDWEGSLSDLGLPCHVDAAINWNEELTVFIGCDIWKMNPVTQIFSLQRSMETAGLPCNIDAAVFLDKGEAIFVKGAQFWRYKSELKGPFHTDDLHLCSWYLCGEADWMREKNRRSQKCNGDTRFCDLRLDQVTLAGLHNAGAGFAGGFGLLDCWLRNHAENITSQLESGIRHLDIDPCFEKCGLLGTCHTYMCGGSICTIIKQVRAFLREHREEVVTINFNHEIYEPEMIFSKLNRQLQVQLGPMLNKKFRISKEMKWPTLRKSIRTNQRVFIFYAPIIVRSPYNRFYNRYKWIHNEDFYGSTWRPFSVSLYGNGCQGIVPLTADRCEIRQNRELVEVSVVSASGACVPSMAGMCRQHHHQTLRVCESFRFAKQKSPNVLLVDYPEVDSQEVTSVFHAVYHQNLRNVNNHLSQTCKVKVDASVWIHESNTTLFFVGKRIQMYSHSKQAQVDSREIPGLHDKNVDAAYRVPATNKVRIVRGCEEWDIDAVTLVQVGTARSQVSPCEQVDGTVIWKSVLHSFKGCNVTPQGLEPIPLTKWGLPCHIDAVLNNNGSVIVFKGNEYWKYTGESVAVLEGKTLDWTVDVVQFDSAPLNHPTENSQTQI